MSVLTPNSKHNWRQVHRQDPPVRSVSERLADFREVSLLFDEHTVREQASRCIQCPNPLCVTGCPLQNRIPEWISLTAEGKFLDAAVSSQSTSNMPEICSRICPQERLCEGACILNARSTPVCIGAIEQFINEYAFARSEFNVTFTRKHRLRVAVVGSGPGGLACADELAKRGYNVTVFDSHKRLGGLLMNGIPAFKLEKHVVERRINLLRTRGILFRPNLKLGYHVNLKSLRRHFDAVFLGLGAQKPKPLEFPGASLANVIDALPFLSEKNAPDSPESSQYDVRGKRVVVLGGGDTAMDCLRTALRCGAREAVCVYRRDEANMPGSKKEYARSLDEGAKFVFLANPVGFTSDSTRRVQSVRCQRMELGPPDSSGRRSPRPIPGTEFVLPADVVLVAYGFDPEPLPPGTELEQLAVNDWGAVVVDANQMTSLPGVFAGGDLVRGPSLAVHAVRDGRAAAAGIDSYLVSCSRNK